jgi:hypothetical protein
MLMIKRKALAFSDGQMADNMPGNGQTEFNKARESFRIEITKVEKEYG